MILFRSRSPAVLAVAVLAASTGCRLVGVDGVGRASTAGESGRGTPASGAPSAGAPFSEDVAGAQPPALPPSASLEDLRRYAQLHNPKLQALEHRVRALFQRAPQARALPEPRFAYTEYLREVETRVGPQERSYALSQVFPWFGKLRLRGSIADESARIAAQQLIAGRLEVDRALRSAYGEYYYLGRSIAVTREILGLLQNLESVARRKLAAGAPNHPALIRLQVEVGRVEDRLATLADRRAPLLARISAILDRPAADALAWPEALDVTPVGLDEATLAAQLAEYSPELLALRHEIERARQQRLLAAKEYFPDFSLGVKTVETSGALAPNTRGSGDDPWMVTFSFELPLWISKYRAGEIEAEERWHSARRRERNALDRLTADVQHALFRQRDSLRKAALYGDSLIPKAEESLRTTEAAFGADLADYLDLIDAERTLLEFKLAEERARADLLSAVAALDALLGRLPVSSATSGDSRENEGGS